MCIRDSTHTHTHTHTHATVSKPKCALFEMRSLSCHSVRPLASFLWISSNRPGRWITTPLPRQQIKDRIKDCSVTVVTMRTTLSMVVSFIVVDIHVYMYYILRNEYVLTPCIHIIHIVPPVRFPPTDSQWSQWITSPSTQLEPLTPTNLCILYLYLLTYDRLAVRLNDATVSGNEKKEAKLSLWHSYTVQCCLQVADLKWANTHSEVYCHYFYGSCNMCT